MQSSQPYRFITHRQLASTQDFADSVCKHGQQLSPSVLSLVFEDQMMIDSAIDVLGAGIIQAPIKLSARSVAGSPHRGKKDSSKTADYRQAFQNGVVGLCDRKVPIKKARLRSWAREDELSKKVFIPTYEIINSRPDVGHHILNRLVSVFRPEIVEKRLKTPPRR